MRHTAVTILTILSLCTCGFRTSAYSDTLRVMGYNALYYGNGCQGPNGTYHSYLRTIVAYANPDVISLEKMASIPVSPGDKYGTAPYGFADSVVKYALDAAFPGRYAHCTFTNNAHNTNMAVIFYDQRKLGFLSIVSSYTNVTDFNTYKFYYRSPGLAQTHDTCFLYIIPNHDMSGDENKAVRAVQIHGVMANLKKHFSCLPNLINLGDFNVRGSEEPFYQELTAAADTNFRFYDPPFYSDHKLSYPANWDHNPDYAAYFTTSTRASASVPNSCGTGGGGKNWYDHIFLSSWIVNNVNHIRYIPGSYRTVGNDGQRLKVAINNANTHANTAAPAEVIEALYQMSNKYPVMADLEITFNGSSNNMANPEIAGAVDMPAEQVTIENPVGDNLVLHLPAAMMGQEITVVCTDKDGNKKMEKTAAVKNAEMSMRCKLEPGEYTVKITGHHNIVAEMTVMKQ